MAMRVFYSFSNHGNSGNTMEQVDKKINEQYNEQITICDIKESRETNLLNKIFDMIDNCDLFVCDLTPDKLVQNDYDDNKTEYWSPNVMIELGYAMAKQNKLNIVLFVDNKVKIPSMLRGVYYEKFLEENASSDDIFEYIVNNYNEVYTKEKNYSFFDYELSFASLNCITQLLDVKTLKFYHIHYDPKGIDDSQIKLFSTGNDRYINIKTKKLHLNNKTMCLSYNKELYDEIKHIELLIKLEQMKK
jgi:hypothetical protein